MHDLVFAKLLFVLVLRVGFAEICAWFERN